MGARVNKLSLEETNFDGDRSRRLLEERAKRLRNREDERSRIESGSSILIFHLSAERFASPMAEISAVVPLSKLTVVPTADPRLLGVMAIKGDVHCIVDLARVLNLPESSSSQIEESGARYVVVLRLSGLHVGFAVDRVESIDELESSTESAGGQRLVRPRSSAPLIMIHQFQTLLETLFSEDDQV